jgi:O-antigen/teichoic acid export membrane protein
MLQTAQQRLQALLKIPFVRSVAKFQVGTIALILLGFVSSVLYARLLGVEQYGLYAVISAFTGVLSIVARFGQEATLATFLSEAYGRRDSEEAARVLRYYVQSTALSLLIYAALYFLAPLLALQFQGDADIGVLARILIINTILQSPAVLAFLVLQMNRQIGLVATLEVARTALQLVFSILFIVLGFRVVGMLMGMVLVSIIYVPICLWLYQRTAAKLGFPTFGTMLSTCLRRDTWTHFSQGLWIAFDQNISKNLYPNMFYLVLNATASLEVVGLFRLALSLGDLPGNLLMPGITRSAAVSIPNIVGQNRKALKSSSIKLIKGTMALIVAGVVGAAVCVPLFLPHVYGEKYIGAIPAFLIIVTHNIFTAVHVVSVPLARVFKRVWAIVVVNITGIAVSGLLYLVLLYVCSPLISISLALVYFHAHSLSLYVYLWTVARKQGVPT